MAKGATIIKVVSILLIIFSVIALIMLIAGAAVAGALVGGANELALSEEAIEAGVDASQITKAAGAIGGAIVVSIIACIVELIAGILGLVFAKKPEKAIVLIVFGVILIVLQIVGIVMGGSFSWTTIVGFILPILYLVGAILNKNGSGEVPPAAPTDVPPAQ